MSDVPMPQGLSQEAVAEWLRGRQSAWPVEVYPNTDRVSGGYFHREGLDAWLARAVLALVEAKVREGVAHPRERVVAQSCGCCSDVVEITPDEIVARVMNKEAPRV